MDWIFLLGVLACPLGMLAMAGVAWLASRTLRERSPRIARLAEHATCMPMAKDRSTQPQSSDQGKETGNERANDANLSAVQMGAGSP